jgi:hypothetical protein
MGRLEEPRWWKLQFRSNPDRHVVLGGEMDYRPALDSLVDGGAAMIEQMMSLIGRLGGRGSWRARKPNPYAPLSMRCPTLPASASTKGPPLGSADLPPAFGIRGSGLIHAVPFAALPDRDGRPVGEP